MPDSVLSRWRNAGTQPSLEQLRRLQQSLQASLLELLVAAGHLTPAEAKLTAVCSQGEGGRPGGVGQRWDSRPGSGKGGRH